MLNGGGGLDSHLLLLIQFINYEYSTTEAVLVKFCGVRRIAKLVRAQCCCLKFEVGVVRRNWTDGSRKEDKVD